MNLRIPLLIGLLTLFGVTLYAQYNVKGRVLSLPDKQPIAYTNIGIMDASIGTISDEDGSFSFLVPAKYRGDSILFSALGYSSIAIPVSTLSRSAEITIFLKETAYELTEVVLTADRVKSKNYRVGNRRYDGGSVYADTATAGSAMALFIHNKSPKSELKFEYPVYAKEAQLRVVRNTFPEFKVRVRLLEADTIRGVPIPGDDILNESVVIESGIIDDWLKIDLSEYVIRIDRDFFIAFEWILDTKDRVRLYEQFENFRHENPDQVSVDYSYVDGKKVAYDNYQGNFYFGTSFGMSVGYSVVQDHICYYRLNSFGKWYRSPSVLAATVTFSDQPGGKPDEDEITTEEDVVDALPSYYLFSPFRNHTSKDSSVQNSPDIDRFYTRFNEPATIEVLRDFNEFSFYAKNISYYPYHIKMNFSRIFNLTPIISTESFTVYPGSMKLLDLDVVDPSIPKYHYDLAVEQTIGDPETRPDLDFPYMVPVDSHDPIQLVSIDSARDRISFPGDLFGLNAGDTVFAMRKGMVSYSSHVSRVVDRLSTREAFEVRHPDNTIMIYYNLDPDHLFVTVGDIIYPGQPIGIIDLRGEISVNLYSSTYNGKVDVLEINYFLDQQSIRNYSELPADLVIDYPESLITSEMDENEKKKYSQNKLFRKNQE